MNRECGGCTVCCAITRVPELNKPAGVMCKHCDHGCTIYPQRPQSCRDFECLWLKSQWMPDELRPDLAGVMFETVPDRQTIVATVDPERPEIGKNPQARAVIEKLVKQGRPVIVISAGHPHPLTILPDGWTVEEAWRGVQAA